VYSGPPLSPLQPELSGASPSTSIAHSIRAPPKLSPPLPLWWRNARTHAPSLIMRSVALRSAPSNVCSTPAPEPGTVDRPRPRIVARDAFTPPRVTGATVVTGASSSMIATSSSTLPPFS
jgi:hypothetical protein